MSTAVAEQTHARIHVLAPVASVAFGLALGAATFLLHGHNAALDAATNSTSTWIIWAAIAGALIPRRVIGMICGAAMMIATCTGYYAIAAAHGLFGAGAIPTAAIWALAGAIGGPILAWAGWSTRRATGLRRHVGVAVIGMAIVGEGLWLGVVLHYWPTAMIFLVVGVLATIALTVYRHKSVGQDAWQPLIYMPILAGIYLAAEYFVLNGLLSSV